MAFLTSRQSWLDKQSSSAPPCITQASYLDAEQIMLAGKSYTLRVLENQSCNRIVLEHEQIVLLMVTDMSLRQRTALFDAWYRINLASRIEPLLHYWQRIMAQEISTWSIMKMKSRWGSCNTRKRSILFNLELAKLSDCLLEYVVVHELAHLIEPSHNHVFKSVVEHFLPDWKGRKAMLRKHIINY
jgi:predicted metal-dependent hydrolase